MIIENTPPIPLKLEYTTLYFLLGFILWVFFFFLLNRCLCLLFVIICIFVINELLWIIISHATFHWFFIFFITFAISLFLRVFRALGLFFFFYNSLSQVNFDLYVPALLTFKFLVVPVAVNNEAKRWKLAGAIADWVTCL